MTYKRYLTTILMALALCVAHAETKQCTLFADDILLGDVNGDGTVNITDVTMTVDHILGNPLTNFNSTMADMNGDTVINVTDVIMIVDVILGNESTEIEDDDQQNPNTSVIFPTIE